MKVGNIYVGVNVYVLHGACAEQVALGSAITAGESDYTLSIRFPLFFYFERKFTMLLTLCWIPPGLVPYLPVILQMDQD